MNYLYTFTLEGNGAKYFNHTHQVQIADGDNGRQWQDNFTFDIKVDEESADIITEAVYLIWESHNGRHYMFTITSKSVSYNGVMPIETISAVNTFAADLTSQQIEEKSFNVPMAKDVFQYCMAGSEWNIHQVDSMTCNETTLSVSGDNAFAAFVSAVTAFDAEVDAWIEFDQFQNIVRNVDIVTHLYPLIDAPFSDVVDLQNGTILDNADKEILTSENNGRTLSYYNGLAGFTRTEDRTQLFTKFYVTGMNGKSIETVNGGNRFIVDDNANDTYNGGRTNYLSTTLVNDQIWQPKALLDWAKTEKNKYNHPAYNYEITTAYMSPEDMPDRGEFVLIINFDISPALIVLAEVISVTESDDNQLNNSIILGEFRTLNPTTPRLISRMQDQSTIIEAIEKAQDDASAITLNLLTPDGDNFSRKNQSKRLILQAMVGKVNITNYLDYKGFEWQRINDDGTLDADWKTPTITNDFRIIRQHENAKIGENHATKLLQFGRYTDFEGALSTAVQYFVPLSDGSYIVNTNRLDAEDDTAFYWLDSTLKVKSSMIVTHGGHGSSFGAQLIDGVPHIWTLLRKSATEGDSSWVGEVTWQTNKRVSYKSKGVKRYCQHSRFMRIGLDEKNNYLLIGYSGGKGTIYICNLDDVKNNVFAPLYSVQQADYGINTALTFQSQSLDFPYLALDYGDYAMKEDHRKVYIINVETSELITEHWYTFSPSGMGDFNATKEPEGIILSHDDSGYYLLQGFNTKGDTFHPVFKMPVTMQGIGKRVEANLNGSLLNLTDDFSGKIRATVESDYLLDDPEVTIDENAAEHITDYKHPDPVKFPDGDYAAQYCVQLEDGSYMTSHHYQGSLADSHKNDTMYIHWDSSFKYLDQMLVQWGGHGSSFGVDMVNGNPWIWSSVIDYDTKKRYIAHFAYRAGTQEKWTSFTNKQLERYCEFNDALRVNYDPLNKLVGVSRQNGDYEVLDVSDVTNNSEKPLYKINIHDYGFDSSKQTYQSQVLDFPYLYWQSGAYDMHDERIMYCVNVVTGALEFTHVYEFKTITPLMTHWEPEGISLIKGTDSDKLLVSFNFNDNTNANHTESFWAIPIKYRDPVPEINNDIGEGDGTQ